MSRRRVIAFDTWLLRDNIRNHGIQVYAVQLLSYFKRMSASRNVEIMPFTTPAMDAENGLLSPAEGFKPRHSTIIDTPRLWRFGGGLMSATLAGADLIFSPTFTTLYAAKSAVVTIHDLIPIVMPWGKTAADTRVMRHSLWWSAKFSKAIITDSEHSKADLLNVFGVPEAKVKVIYLGYDKSRFNTEPADAALLQSVKSRFNLRSTYILHCGVIKPSKNLARLIQAYRIVQERNPNLECDLVLAGRPGWEYDDVIQLANETSARGRVVLTGGLEDDELLALLKGATLSVVPSLYEGFCLPMLESMASGIPTLASRSSCLPEISGGVLKYFDPESVEEMADRIEETLESAELRSQLAAKGLERAAYFDWHRCAEETLEFLTEMAGS